MLFSATPFVAVQALADSKYGKQLLERLEAQKPLLRKQAEERERERRVARQQRWAACFRGGAWREWAEGLRLEMLERLTVLMWTSRCLLPLQPLVWRRAAAVAGASELPTARASQVGRLSGAGEDGLLVQSRAVASESHSHTAELTAHISSL